MVPVEHLCRAVAALLYRRRNAERRGLTHLAVDESLNLGISLSERRVEVGIL